MFTTKEAVLSKFTRNINSIRNELDDHLDAINGNTEEIGSFDDKLAEVDSKIDKLNSRIDSIHMMFRQLLLQTKVSVELNEDEQKVFVMLNNYKNFLRLDDIALKIGMENEEVIEITELMQDKGVPVVKKQFERRTVLKLDDEFRELQQKEQLIRINPAITKQFENKVLANFFI